MLFQVHTHRHATRLLVALLATLAGCGGGGRSALPAPTAQAVDDSFTLAAGAAADLAVLNNDAISGGTATLTVAVSPSHGKVTVQGTSLRYTPDAGFFGTDQFTYRADVGTASGTATVNLTVEAEFELAGTVPGINSLTEVTAQVGEASVRASTDDTGAYKLNFKTSKPTAFVTLTAKESGARAAYTRTSLVGEAGTLYTQVGARVSATQWPALTLDALSTARAGLLKLRGLKPATTAELKSALADQDPRDLLDAATLLRHVFEDGASLPSGVATTDELAGSPTALAGVQQAWSGGSVSDPVQVERTLAQSTTAAAPVTAGQARQIVTHFGAGNLRMPTSSLFDLRADGSGQAIVWSFPTNTAVATTWSVSGNVVSIQLANPLPFDGSYRARAVQIRALRGVDTLPHRQWMLRWQTDCQITPSQPASYCTTPSYTPWVPVVSFDVERDRQPLRLVDMTAGTVWAGLITQPELRWATCMCEAREVVNFDGTPNVPGFSGRLEDGRWLLKGAQLNYRYTRLAGGAEPGLEYWLAELQEGTTTTGARLVLVVKGQPLPPFDVATVARRWGLFPHEDTGSADVTGARTSVLPVTFNLDGRLLYNFGSGPVDIGHRWALSDDKSSWLEIWTDGGASYTWLRPVRAVTGGYIGVATSGAGLIRVRDVGPAN